MGTRDEELEIGNKGTGMEGGGDEHGTKNGDKEWMELIMR